MVQVVLPAAMRAAVGGRSTLDVEAANIQQLLARLGDEHPQLKPLLERGVAVSINGQIYRDAWFQPIPPGAEVYLLPRMAGG
jgi:molybdopterin converting factor small subunit